MRPKSVAGFVERMQHGMAQGVLSFPLTPYHEDGSSAPERFRSYVRSQLQAGPGAMFVCCGTGEFSALDAEEFGTCVSIAVEESNGQLPVVAGVGYGWRLAASWCAIAENAGADGVLLFPPYLVTGPQEGLVAHVGEVASRTSLPVIVYQRGSVDLAPDSVRCLGRLPNVVGLKDGHGRLERIVQQRQAAPSDWLFFNGTPTAEIQAAAFGAVGVPAYSSAVHAFAPEIARAFFRALHRDDWPSTDRLLREFYLPLVELRDQRDGYAVALIKAAARLRGYSVGPVRAPLADPTPAHVDTLRGLVETGLGIARELGTE